MTDPVIDDVKGFDESAFDAELDARWRDFRLRLADRLADLVPGLPFAVYGDEDCENVDHPYIEVVARVDERLEIVVETEQLADDSDERSARIALLRENGWGVHGDDTVSTDYAGRHVDAVAVAVEFVLRQVWDVPDPAYLVGGDPGTTE